MSVFAANAQTTINLWSSAHPAPHKSPLGGVETVADSAGRISNISIPTITVFSPAKNVQNSGRAVIICPGGGYWLATTGEEGSDIAQLLAQQGITGIVLKYRMPGGVHQLPLEDFDRAMEITVQNAAQWGVDTSKIGVMGFSAGGHLAAVASTMASRRPNFSVLYYPVISMREGITHEGSRHCLMGADPLRHYYSAELQVDNQTPPALLIHCADDQTVNIANSYLYKAALQSKNIPVQMITYPTGGHGWGARLSFANQLSLRKQVIDWINGI